MPTTKPDAACCEFCGSTDGHPDGIELHLPLTLDSELLQCLGAGIWKHLPGSRPVHAVALATGGVPLGLACIAGAPPFRLRSVTVAKPAYDFDSPGLAVGAGESVVVLDNSLHTGRSLAMAIDYIQSRNLVVERVITAFDAANDCERRARSRLEATTGVPVHAVYPLPTVTNMFSSCGFEAGGRTLTPPSESQEECLVNVDPGIARRAQSAADEKDGAPRRPMRHRSQT